MDDLEDQAAAADAELERGDGVLLPAEAWAPLHVESHNQAVEATAVDALDLRDPVVHHGRRSGYLSEDDVVVEVYGVFVVGVVLNFVFAYAYCHSFLFFFFFFFFWFFFSLKVFVFCTRENDLIWLLYRRPLDSFPRSSLVFPYINFYFWIIEKINSMV